MVFKEHFFLVYFICVGWVIGLAILSVFFRKRKRKPIFRPEFPNSRFSERWRSGRSFKSVWTRLGGAKNCLWITVTDDELWLCPHFPFNLGFLPEMGGLECRIPGINILSVERKQTLLGSTVLIRFRNANGIEEAFEVNVRDVEAFDRAIEEIRKPHVST